MAWFFAAVGAVSAVINRGWLADLHWPRWYRGRHRNPSAQHPAAKALDTRPSSKPLSHTERLLEAHFDDEPQDIRTAR